MNAHAVAAFLAARRKAVAALIGSELAATIVLLQLDHVDGKTIAIALLTPLVSAAAVHEVTNT